MSADVGRERQVSEPPELDAAVMTDIGLVRRSNQDAYAADEELGLFVVCDGMGGPAGGEIASVLAADTFVSVFRQEFHSLPANGGGKTALAMERAALAANRAVCARAAYDTRFRGMGTTLVAARFESNVLTVLNVGDSRAYRLRDGELTQLSRDHSFVHEQVELGLLTPEEAVDSPHQSVITRAIGAESDVHPDVFLEALHPGDGILLASDGLTRHLTDATIAGALAGAHNASAACAQLIELAKEDGGSDNITCFVIRVGATPRR
jgi:serine/threonine protein phosphatase PrpC